jgi:hypothetical protein
MTLEESLRPLDEGEAKAWKLTLENIEALRSPEAKELYGSDYEEGRKFVVPEFDRG